MIDCNVVVIDPKLSPSSFTKAITLKGCPKNSTMLRVAKPWCYQLFHALKIIP
jgi:hypothetical protein